MQRRETILRLHHGASAMWMLTANNINVIESLEFAILIY